MIGGIAFSTLLTMFLLPGLLEMLGVRAIGVRRKAAPLAPFESVIPYERLPEALQGLSYEVEYRPILFAAILVWMSRRRRI